MTTAFALSPERTIVAHADDSFTIRLHQPEETTQQALDGLEAVEKGFKLDNQDIVDRYRAAQEQLFSQVSKNVKRIVRQSLAPISSLRNPIE
jgi:hypothetical protein